MEINLEELTAKITAEIEAKAKAKADAEAVAAMKAELDALRAEKAEGNRLPFSGKAPTVLNIPTEFDNLDVADHALLIDILDSNKRTGRGGSSDGSFKAYTAKVEAEASKDKAAFEAAKAIKTAKAMKSNELDYSTYSSYGDQWVGVAYSTALWESIRQGTFVVNNLPTIEVPRGTESITLPLESTDPTFYKVAEATSHDSTMLFPVATVTSSKLATSNVSLTLSKLGARVPWSGELEERSLIPWVAQLRQQLQNAGAEYLESAIIDGDTATTYTTNINDIANTTDMTATEYCLVWNGFRKSPLVTTTANSRSAGGSLDVTDYLNTVKLMNSGINALDRSKVSFIIDPSTHYATLALPELMTRDVYTGATVEGGIVTNIWGYPIRVSGQMCKYSSARLSNSAGKVDTDTTTNNAYGSILAVRWDQWRFGWQRRATIEVTRYPRSDSSEIVMLMTCGLIQRDTEASAITYYVGV
jgi:HK97 family phage major capsid protein